MMAPGAFERLEAARPRRKRSPGGRRGRGGLGLLALNEAAIPDGLVAGT